MAQETTEEFGKRLNQSVEGHPLSPPTPHGRQSWLLAKLKTETGLVVSPNTMSKWFNGTARPRTDNIRKIAQVLSVDEVWLTLGRRPTEKPQIAQERATSAQGAVLLVAGLVEMNGGRFSFPAADDAWDLSINIGGSRFTALIQVANVKDENTFSCIVPEPIGSSRILIVVQERQPELAATACVTFLDVTGAPRQSLGGYSVITLRRESCSDYAAEGGSGEIIRPVRSVSELAGG